MAVLIIFEPLCRDCRRLVAISTSRAVARYVLLSSVNSLNGRFYLHAHRHSILFTGKSWQATYFPDLNSVSREMGEIRHARESKPLKPHTSSMPCKGRVQDNRPLVRKPSHDGCQRERRSYKF